MIVAPVGSVASSDTFNVTGPVKLRQARLIGGQLAMEVIYIHRPTQITGSNNAIFYTDGLVGNVPTKILLDTGAAVFVA